MKRAQLEYRFSSSHRISPRVGVVPCREIQREWAWCLPLRLTGEKDPTRGLGEAGGDPLYELCRGPC